MKIAPVALYTLVGLLAAAAGYLSYRHHLRSEPQLVSIPTAPRAPQAITTAPEQSPGAAIPEEVPDLKLPDMGGTMRALRAIPGRTRLFNFWASWCEPCRREIPLLNALQSAHKADGLQIAGIAVDTRAAVQTFLKHTPLHYIVLVGEEDGAEAAQKFGMELALPFTVFADARNRIVAIKLGELHQEEADAILGHLDQVNAGTETLAASRTAIATALKALAVERAKQSHTI